MNKNSLSWNIDNLKIKVDINENNFNIIVVDEMGIERIKVTESIKNTVKEVVKETKTKEIPNKNEERLKKLEQEKNESGTSL